MTNLTTFTKRLAIRLSTFNNAVKVREAAKGIEKTINDEIQIIMSYNEDNGTAINECALEFLVYKNGTIPATRAKQQAWLSAVTAGLKAA